VGSLRRLTMQPREEFLLAGASNVIQIRFALDGSKLTNMIQFVSRTGRICCLRGQFGVIAACSFPIAGLLGSSRRSIQSSEPSGIDFESSFEFLLCFFRLTDIKKQTAELFANWNKRAR